jgi:hypothetical protein
MTLYRETLWKGTEEFKFPEELLNMCKICVQKTRSAVEYKEHCHPFLRIKQDFKKGRLPPILFNLTLQKVIQTIKMVPSGIKIGKEQFNVCR